MERSAWPAALADDRPISTVLVNDGNGSIAAHDTRFQEQEVRRKTLPAAVSSSKFRTKKRGALQGAPVSFGERVSCYIV
jgi:hypothetical protein